MNESTQDQPGEPDTETEGGFPKESPESKDGEQQSKQDQPGEPDTETEGGFPKESPESKDG
jgi:hypothetical protein